MNKAILMGRLTRDPEVRYSQGNNSMAVARYTLAVDRRTKKDGEEQTADFIPCVAFGKAGEFAEKYLRQGIKIVVTGRITTGSYTNREGQRVYTTEITVEEQEFAESKNSNSGGGFSGGNSAGFSSGGSQGSSGGGFMSAPDDEQLPFD